MRARCLREKQSYDIIKNGDSFIIGATAHYADSNQKDATDDADGATLKPILYAMTDDGLRLPVIDVTHPAFFVEATEEAIREMTREFVREMQNRPELPPAAREAMKRSRLGGALMAASGSYLTGIETYMLKLGPDNLGAVADPIDRRIAASFPAYMTRFRLRDTARLLADGLARIASTGTRRPISLIDIAGGPAADSWNALIYLRAEHPDLLTSIPISILVLDIDRHGPAFASRALDAMRAPGAPLGGLDIAFRHVPYDWSHAANHLPAILGHGGLEVVAANAACAVCSEGGLFQYGSDADITSNLATLRAATPTDALVVGSVTRDDDAGRAAQAASGVATRPMSIVAFRQLASDAGWRVERIIERPFSYNLCLVKA